MKISNPFNHLSYEYPLQSLGENFYEKVKGDIFPNPQLRFRNDSLLSTLGLNDQEIKDDDFINFFGKFQSNHHCLALKYHGYQFGQYNPYLGDGRGFLYGQIRGINGKLYDFGTKGTGKTPFSQGRDGKLTLKGGIREVLASEMLYRLGVKTSRCLCLIETGELIERENQSHCGAMMVRFSESHLRFGSFERLNYHDRPDLIKILLNHVIQHYYPTLWGKPDQYLLFYHELVQRFAHLAAQWMMAGFCHGVLNTDNMSIVGESFDYGPYQFIDYYNPNFTAASFDTLGRYSYRNQPGVCRENLHFLQSPLSSLMSLKEMESILDKFPDYYSQFYRKMMLNRLGFDDLSPIEAEELLSLTLQFFLKTRFSYSHFFQQLRQQFSPQWVEDESLIMKGIKDEKAKEVEQHLKPWRKFYYYLLLQQSPDELTQIDQRLKRYNPSITLLDHDIEMIWNSIIENDKWQAFYELLHQLQTN